MTPPLPPKPPSRGFWQKLYTTRPLTGAAVIVGWLGVYLVYTQHLAGFVLAGVTTLLAMLSLRRGRALADTQREQYRIAYEAARARNRELDSLTHLASTLLAGTDLQVLFHEVAKAAAELIEAEAGAITLMVEEGRFLRIVAATGPMKDLTGTLVPVDESLIGWVTIHEEPLLCADMDIDPRSFPPPPGTEHLHGTAIVPLRSAEVVIGTVSVYSRRGGKNFGPHDLQLLRTLGEQAVIGLDRAHVLEESQKNAQELAAKNRELQRATQLKSEFLANMSHELRTPLNSIIGFSDLILTEAVGPVTEQQREFLEAVLRNGRHLLGLINSILDLSKIEAGRMTLELAETDLRDAINGAVTDTRSLRQAKGQECTVQMDDAPLQVLADALRVRQILFNLLSNASKFTPDGGTITLSAVKTRAPMPSPAGRSGELPKLVSRDAAWVSVIDTGVGIKPEDMSKLFQEFSQVDTSASRKAQGTGLGLALSKQFVEMHGGTIGAESIYGTGSTFWFLLPIEGPIRRPKAITE